MDFNGRDLAERLDAFDAAIQRTIGDKIQKTDDQFAGYPDHGDLFSDERDEFDIPPAEPDALMPDADDVKDDDYVTDQFYDEYIGAEVLVDVGDEKQRAVVKKRVVDTDGNPVGKRNDNYMLDTREYELEFDDGTTEIYSSNIVMENIYTQVNDEGRMFVLMEEIIDHKKDDSAIPISEGTFIRNNSVRKKRTTRGWKLLVQWKDGTTSWVRLADMKESFPLETAEYDKRNMHMVLGNEEFSANFTLRFIKF